MKKVLRYIYAAFLSLAFSVHTAHAEQRFVLGSVITHTNDYLVDGQDRWRTASLSVSELWGASFSGQAPRSFGALLEFRTRFEIIAPADLSVPDTGTDRPYVGAISFGIFSHQQRGSIEVISGAELVFIGPSTGVGQLQAWLHKGSAPINPQILQVQLPDALYPTVKVEVGRRFEIAPKLTLRPFSEAQIGVETYARAGFDMVFSANPAQDLRLREGVTGQRLPALHVSGHQSWGLGLGGDITYIVDSKYFRPVGAITFKQTRTRLRAGAFYQGDQLAAFYGVAWLSPEFTTQSEGQFVAALSVSLRF